MDPNAAAAAIAPQATTLVAWITQYGNIVAFFAQLVYWVALIVLLAYAVAQYKRWVNYQLGIGRSGKLRRDLVADDEAVSAPAPATKSKKKKPVSVEEFVE